MYICEYLPEISKSLAIIGLSLDIYGIFELFKLEPEPLSEANESQFEASLTEWKDSEKIKKICFELNRNIQDLRFNHRVLRRKARRFKKIILLGFALQIISIFLSFFYN
jgi:hypothetical protein